MALVTLLFLVAFPGGSLLLLLALVLRSSELGRAGIALSLFALGLLALGVLSDFV